MPLTLRRWYLTVFTIHLVNVTAYSYSKKIEYATRLLYLMFGM